MLWFIPVLKCDKTWDNHVKLFMIWRDYFCSFVNLEPNYTLERKRHFQIVQCFIFLRTSLCLIYNLTSYFVISEICCMSLFGCFSFEAHTPFLEAISPRHGLCNLEYKKEVIRWLVFYINLFNVYLDRTWKCCEWQ